MKGICFNSSRQVESVETHVKAKNYTFISEESGYFYSKIEIIFDKPTKNVVIVLTSNKTQCNVEEDNSEQVVAETKVENFNIPWLIASITGWTTTTGLLIKEYYDKKRNTNFEIYEV